MKIIPIRRKGCKNAGWIWDDSHLNRMVVPLHHGKPFKYVSDVYQMENVYFDKKGGLKKISNIPNYLSLLEEEHVKE